MTAHKPAVQRCAVYTRKSSEEGLEQDFNSLHAQREACEAFILSQKHEGWKLIEDAYDDGGISGGTMGRPALQRLLSDIKDHKVDVIVVYKVDRLTRSLADFARMVELFDLHNVSFVSVTQQFNTTSSMGRLTLNVLLSFAQFEREVTGERIRDKIAASKAKGIWMGGFPPLGYDVVERKLIVNTAEAETVRHIFALYLKIGNVRLLQKHLSQHNIRSKLRGSAVRPGGYVFSRGMLYNFLSNSLYIGQIRHKDVCHPGQHERIIDQALWDEVQHFMKDSRNGVMPRARKTHPGHLKGKVFDVNGERLVVIHASKRGRRYRYYTSESLARGLRTESPNGWRLPGVQLEATVFSLTKTILVDRNFMATELQAAGISHLHMRAVLSAIKEISKKDPQEIFEKFVQRVEVGPEGISITLSLALLLVPQMEKVLPSVTRHEPMQMQRCGNEMRLMIEGQGAPINIDPILIKTIARAHVWSQELLTGRASSMAEIASRHGVSDSYVKKIMPLAFLAPDIMDAIIAGKQPAKINTQLLIRGMEIPSEWQEQRRAFGFKA